mgnify:CR=1 FL=1
MTEALLRNRIFFNDVLIVTYPIMATSIKKNGIEKRKSERIYELKNALAYAKAIVNTIR